MNPQQLNDNFFIGHYFFNRLYPTRRERFRTISSYLRVLSTAVVCYHITNKNYSSIRIDIYTMELTNNSLVGDDSDINRILGTI